MYVTYRRLNQIKEVVLTKNYLKISDLCKELGVSYMTIHRDLKPLIEQGISRKNVWWFYSYT